MDAAAEEEEVVGVVEELGEVLAVSSQTHFKRPQEFLILRWKKHLGASPGIV